jgi:prepilin-type N-terminal cleavage/methylation domain-containing protein
MKNKGFTLIELLIVIAIILILIAIALPNFLEAQIRAKVARLKGDVRTMVIAAESYQVDMGQYPAPSPEFFLGNPDWLYRQNRITTPIAYITALPEDIFRSPHSHNMKSLMDFEVNGEGDPYGGIPSVWFTQDPNTPLVRSTLLVYIRSWGPDQLEEGMTTQGWSTLNAAYSPTNGTMSRGDLWGVLPGPIYY